MRLPEHKKHCFVYVFIAFHGPRTQQTLLLQGFSYFLSFQNTKDLLLQCFPVVSASGRNTTNSICSMISYFFCFRKTTNVICSMLSYFLCFQARSKGRVVDGGVLGMHRLARKHKKQERIEQNRVCCVPEAEKAGNH